MPVSRQPDTAKPFMSRAGRKSMENLFACPRFAHHPDCSCFDGHVLRIGKLVLCLGCTCLATGVLVATAILVSLFLDHGMPDGWCATLVFVVTGVCLYAPTLLQPFCQWKPFKGASRFLLGAAIATLGAGGLVLPPLNAFGFTARAVFMVGFWLVCKATLRQRARWTPDPCSRCGASVFPFCQDNRPRVVSLVAELRRNAGPEDAAFVAFAAALAGDDAAGVSVDVTSMRALVGEEAKMCHWTER